MSLFGWGQVSIAQVEEQIEVVNQDGEKLDPGQLNSQLLVDGRQLKKGAKFSVNDGTITIVNEDGTTREIDVAGAQRIVISNSMQSIVENGKEKTRVQGKAILIGPDGKRQEFDLSDGDLPDALGAVSGLGDRVGLLKGQLQSFGNKAIWRFPSSITARSGGKYMVGVHCNPVSEVLSSQLGLAENVGLVVVDVTPDSPAANAGLQRNDILTYADQKALKTTEDLVNAAQKAGPDSSSISFSLLRRGKDVTIIVTPAERPNIQPGGFKFVNPGNLGPGVFQFDEIGPGMIFKSNEQFGDFNKDFHKQFEDMHRMMQEQVERMNQLQKRFDNFQNKDN